MSSVSSKIRELVSMNDGYIVTITAVVKYVQDVCKITPKTGDLNRALRKRSILVCDDSGVSVWVSLWNSLAESFNFKVDDIVNLCRFKVIVFNNSRSLSSMSFSAVIPSPLSGKDADSFKQSSINAIPVDGYKSIKEMKASATSENQFIWIKASVFAFNIDKFYDGCSVCSKKKDSVICSTCCKSTESVLKLVATLYVSDESDSLKVIAFSECVYSFTRICVKHHKDYSLICSRFVEQTVVLRVKYKKIMYGEQEKLDVIAISIAKAIN